MSMMREVPYLLSPHYMAVALRPISFPATKEAIIQSVGKELIRTQPEAYTAFEEILKALPLEEFSCAAEFYCALNAS